MEEYVNSQAALVFSMIDNLSNPRWHSTTGEMLQRQREEDTQQTLYNNLPHIFWTNMREEPQVHNHNIVTEEK